VASLDTPIPVTEDLEKQIYWPKQRLPEMVRQLLEY